MQFLAQNTYIHKNYIHKMMELSGWSNNKNIKLLSRFQHSTLVNFCAFSWDHKTNISIDSFFSHFFNNEYKNKSKTYNRNRYCCIKKKTLRVTDPGLRWKLKKQKKLTIFFNLIYSYKYIAKLAIFFLTFKKIIFLFLNFL